MINELSGLGKMLRSQKADLEWVHDALKEETVSIDIVITNEGEFFKFEQFEKITTIAEAITAKKGKARLLLDKAEEVLGYGGASSLKKHNLFLDKLAEYGGLPELLPVLAFYEKNKKNGVDKALGEFELAIPDEKNRKGNLAFRVQSEVCRIHEKPEVLKTVITKYDIQQEKLTSLSKKYCSICGMTDYPVVDIPHGMVKKVPDGQSSGCALVSYNEDAFESYGLKGNNNSSICTNCAKTYVEGLNWLLSSGNEEPVINKSGKEKVIYRYSNRKNFGSDTAMVFWTRKNQRLPELDQLEEPKPSDIAKLIESVASGNETDSDYLDPDQFYSFCLSGSAARISVRDWIELSLFEMRKSIAQWFQDIAVTEYDWDSKTYRIHYARLYDMSRNCQRQNSDGKADKDDTALARVAAQLWNAALKNTAPPLWILTRVLQRARLDDAGINSDKAALIKLILNRNFKGGGFVITDRIQQDQRPVAYVCGQIFAKLENIQYAALEEVNAGIRERYFTYAMTMPAAAFGRLFNLNSKHFTKLKNIKPGLAVNLDKELQDLCKDIDINSFPASFSLEEQGQFAIGYYHQKQAQFNSMKKNENKTEEK
jgi:CRISPR-associated protein Csd1